MRGMMKNKKGFMNWTIIPEESSIPESDNFCKRCLSGQNRCISVATTNKNLQENIELKDTKIATDVAYNTWK